MTLRIILLLLSITVPTSSCYSQNECLLEIEYDDFSLYPETVLPNDSINKDWGGNKIIKVFLFDCKGHAYVQVFDTNKVLLREGNYINSLDTLKEYVDVYDEMGDLIEFEPTAYFKPLRDGEWKFYKNGKVKIVTYRKGVLWPPDQTIEIE